MAVAVDKRLETLAEQKTVHRSEWQRARQRFWANRLAVIGLLFIIFLVFIAVFADVLAPYDPIKNFPGRTREAPSLAHPFGFDDTGRDILSRMLYGTRVELLVALLASAVAVVIGVAVGAISGYFGGWADTILSRIVDTLMAFPIIALLIVLASVVGPSIPTTIFVLGATTWARYARVVRGDVLSLKKQEFIIAAQACGANSLRIIWRHILPNVLGPVIVLASLGVGIIIILESALSFLGLGVQPPDPSWGRTLSDGRAYLRNAPHISIFPGLLIVATVLAFNFLGDGLRDALDPRQKD